MYISGETGNFIKTEKNSILQWIRKHKKGVICGVVVTAAFVGVAVYLATKNNNTASEVAETIIDTAKADYTSIKLGGGLNDNYVEKRIYIPPHIMNLPLWKNPSMQKLASALENGFDPKELLENHQTWVKGHWRTIRVLAKNAIREMQKAA